MDDSYPFTFRHIYYKSEINQKKSFWLYNKILDYHNYPKDSVRIALENSLDPVQTAGRGVPCLLFYQLFCDTPDNLISLFKF